MIALVQKYTSHLRSKKLWMERLTATKQHEIEMVRNINWAINRNEVEK